MVTYLVKLAPSAIGVVDPCPYFSGWSLLRMAVDGSHAPMFGDKADALRMTRSDAFESAKRWGPDWRDVVRVVRVGRRRG